MLLLHWHKSLVLLMMCLVVVILVRSIRLMETRKSDGEQTKGKRNFLHFFFFGSPFLSPTNKAQGFINKFLLMSNKIILGFCICILTLIWIKKAATWNTFCNPYIFLFIGCHDNQKPKPTTPTFAIVYLPLLSIQMMVRSLTVILIHVSVTLWIHIAFSLESKRNKTKKKEKEREAKKKK